MEKNCGEINKMNPVRLSCPMFSLLEGDDRGWDSWMASLTWWTWVWVNSGSWWCTGRSGVLRFMGLQGQAQLSDWTELNWTPYSVNNDFTRLCNSWDHSQNWACMLRGTHSVTGYFVLYTCLSFTMKALDAAALGLHWSDIMITLYEF